MTEHDFLRARGISVAQNRQLCLGMRGLHWLYKLTGLNSSRKAPIESPANFSEDEIESDSCNT